MLTGKFCIGLFVAFFALLLSASGVAAAPLINPDEQGIWSGSRSSDYDSLLSALTSNGKSVVSVGDNMWVPWFKTSSSCGVSDLQSGSNCNAGTINFDINCMVTDEYSQVGIVVAMGNDPAAMERFYNTLSVIKSTNGDIPAWRIYRNGNSIEPCKQGINGNCDTASDATARIIIALFTASKNSNFNSDARARYAALGEKLSADFLNYEVDRACRPSSLGYGDICFWMAGGSNVKRSGIGSGDYAYTGYFADGIIAMLQAYASTGDDTYLEAAKHFTLNYLQASNFDGNAFTTPPGKSFKWVPDQNGVPRAQCTNTCSPVQWDGYDAPRALGMCQAQHYAGQMNVTLPGLRKYCELWSSRHMTNPGSAPLQYFPDGTASSSYQSGYFAQGLQSLFQSGGNPGLFKPTLDSALHHYNPSTRTFDSTPCFGVYTQAFAMRSLGMGIGRDAASFGISSSEPAQPIDEVSLESPEVPVEPVELPVAEPEPVVAPVEFDVSFKVVSTDGLKASFLCEHNSEGTFNIDWFADRDGFAQQNLAMDVTTKGFSHTFAEPGTYRITCGVWSDAQQRYADGTATVTVARKMLPELMLSFKADRSGAAKLDGQVVSGSIYVFASPDGNIAKVDFYVDNLPGSGVPYKSEYLPAFDLAGTHYDRSALPFSTLNLAAGKHTITAIVRMADGSIEVLQGTFSIASTTTSLAKPALACTDKTLGKACVKLSGIDTGACRTVTFAEPGKSAVGIKAQACKKSNNVLEVYRQYYNSQHNLEVCFSGICVDKYWGFRKGTV